MKKLIRDIVKYSKIYNLARPWYAGKGCILVMHRICPETNKSKIRGIRGEQVTPGYLEKVIEYFQTMHYQAVSIDEVDRILSGKLKLKHKFIAYTFDDGYKDNYTLAYPIFKKYSIPFTIFVTPGFLDGKATLWSYLLDDLLMQNNIIEFELENKKYVFKCSSVEEKECSFWVMSNLIKGARTSNYCHYVLNRIFKLHDSDLYKKTAELILTWENIIEMSNAGLVTIGAHTTHHLKLNELSLAQLKQEIMESRRTLELRLNKKVEHFSYPFGGGRDIGKREIEVVKECGFKTATTMTAANIMIGHKDYCCSLPRIHANGDDEDIEMLDMYVSGFFPCINNRFKRIIV